MDVYPQRVYVVERHVTIVATKYVQFALEIVGSVTTAWRGFGAICEFAFPQHVLEVQCVQVVHPVGAIKSAKQIHGVVDQAAGHADTRCGWRAFDGRLAPCHGCGVQTEQVVELSISVRLTTEYV